MPISSTQLQNILDKISEVNHYFNESIDLVSITKQPCPDCDIDPITNEASDSFCETCGGSGYIETETILTIVASVEYESEFEKIFTKIGEFSENKIVVTIDTKEITENNIDLNTIQYIKWQGNKYKTNKTQPNYLQGVYYETNLWCEKI